MPFLDLLLNPIILCKCLFYFLEPGVSIVDKPDPTAPPGSGVKLDDQPLSFLHGSGTATVQHCASSLDKVADSVKENSNLFAGHTPSFKKLLSFAHPPKNESNLNKDAKDAAHPVQSPNFTFPIPSTSSFVPTKKVSPVRRVNEAAENEKSFCDISEGSGDDTFIVTTVCDLPIPLICSSETDVTDNHVQLPKQSVKAVQEKEIVNTVPNVYSCSHSDSIQSELLHGIQQMNLDTTYSNPRTSSVAGTHSRIPHRTMPNSGSLSIPDVLIPRYSQPKPGLDSVQTVNSQTVTKSKPSTVENLENERMVKRAIDFKPGTPQTPSEYCIDLVKVDGSIRKEFICICLYYFPLTSCMVTESVGLEFP